MKIVFSYNCMNIAVIPARGGSKGVPRKNIKPLNKQPLISYCIEAAHNSKVVDEVVVSTDSIEIKDVARACGATVIDRPEVISGDHVSSEEAILHVLESSKYRESDLTIFLQCTSPFLSPTDIDATVGILQRKRADTALTVTPFSHFLWSEHGDGINHDKNKRFLRQDLDFQFLETGAVYVMKTVGFLEHKHRFFGDTALCVIQEQWRALEIDTEADFELAEFLMRKYGSQSNR